MSQPETLCHTGIMNILAACPNLAWIRRSPTRLLWVVALLGLVLGSIPRWEMHQHVPESHRLAHGHDHPSPHHDDIDDLPSGVPAADATGTHGHEMPTISVVLFESESSQPHLFRPPAIDLSASESSAPSRCWPPPYRPPIA